MKGNKKLLTAQIDQMGLQNYLAQQVGGGT